VSPTDPLPAVVARLRGAGCVFAEDEARLLVAQARNPAELAHLVAHRVAGLPLEQVLGWAEFRGLRIVLAPGVFVPRRRTEFLVEQALAEQALAEQALAERVLAEAALAADRRGPLVLDLCCGSGAVGLAVATELAARSVATERAIEPVELHAADVDPAAVECARRNLAGVGGRVHLGDLYEALPDELAGRVDLLVTVTPYVPSQAIALMPPEARDHEPRRALDGGADGLDVLRRVIDSAPRWLAPGGSLLAETGRPQAAAAAATLAGRGLTARVATEEGAGATVVIGTLR
jgi:release factor glutamine methyltransferase